MLLPFQFYKSFYSYVSMSAFSSELSGQELNLATAASLLFLVQREIVNLLILYCTVYIPYIHICRRVPNCAAWITMVDPINLELYIEYARLTAASLCKSQHCSISQSPVG